MNERGNQSQKKKGDKADVTRIVLTIQRVKENKCKKGQGKNSEGTKGIPELSISQQRVGKMNDGRKGDAKVSSELDEGKRNSQRKKGKLKHHRPADGELPWDDIRSGRWEDRAEQ